MTERTMSHVVGWRLTQIAHCFEDDETLWDATVRYERPDGERRSVKRRFRSERDARTWLRSAKRREKSKVK